jgi:hypothetical protein
MKEPMVFASLLAPLVAFAEGLGLERGRILAHATLLERFDVTLLSEKPSRPARRNLTMGPHDGLPVRVTRREPRGRSQERAARLPGPVEPNRLARLG